MQIVWLSSFMQSNWLSLALVLNNGLDNLFFFIYEDHCFELKIVQLLHLQAGVLCQVHTDTFI